MWKRYGVAGAVFLAGLFGQNSGDCPAKLSPTMAVRNAEIALTLATPPNVKNGVILLEGNGLKRTQPVALENNTVRYALPSDLPLGRYTVTAELDKRFYPACELLNVVPALNRKLSLAPFEPEATYETETVWIPEAPGSKTGKAIQTARIKLRGSGFVMDPPGDNQIVVNGDLLTPTTWDGCDTGRPTGDRNNPLTTGTVHGRVISPEMIDLCGVPVPPDRELRVAVKQGDSQTGLQAFRVYRWSTFPVAAAGLAIALSLGLVVLWLIHLLTRRETKTKKFNALKVLFLDPETDSYSLSKLQFYCWTAAALFGYSYLVIGRMLVQGQVWPDIPGTLPGIVAIGAGTSVGAQFVTSVRGPKGSGSEQPSLGDFVTSGGVAAPERVQMLVWTIFGVIAFCLAAVRYGPGTIKTLDAVPEGMLYLMGLSSAGYLGGKLARKPGPVINEISITPGESDEALASAAAPPPPGPPDLSQPVAQAQAVQQTFANGPAGSAQTALSEAIQLSSQVRTVADAQSAVKKLAGLRTQAEAAAKSAADTFAQAGAPPEAARAAETAEQAAAALQELSSAVSSDVAIAMGPMPPGASTGPIFTRSIELRGRNLSSEALIEIDGAEMPFRMLRKDDEGRRLPEVVVKEPDDPRLARVLRLSIDSSQLEASDFSRYKKWFGATDLKNAKVLVVINPDGQKAAISFTVPPSAAQSSVKTQHDTAVNSPPGR